MKKISLFCLFSIALMLLSSCLGDSATSFTMSNAAGVVDYTEGGVKLIHVKGGEAVSSKEFQQVQIDDGTCILFDYSIDYGSGDNVDKGKEKGYMTATIYENTIWEVPQFPMAGQLVDTTAVLDREMSVYGMQERFAYIEGKLFLYLELTNHTAMQVDSFSLSYNPAQQLDKENVYDLYLRAINKEKNEGDESRNMLVPCSFDIKDFVDQSIKDKTVKFRVNYVSGFNSDTTACKWKATEIFTIDQQEDKK